MGWSIVEILENFHHIMMILDCILTIPYVRWNTQTQQFNLSKAEWRINASVNYTVIGSDNGASPGRRRAIIWTNAGLLLIGPLRTNFSEILFEMHTFLFKTMHLNLSSEKWKPFCLGLSVLNCSITSNDMVDICDTHVFDIRCLSDPVYSLSDRSHCPWYRSLTC